MLVGGTTRSFINYDDLLDGCHCSVTRFGEILPLWENFNSLWLYFRGMSRKRQKIVPTLANCYAVGQSFIVVNGQMLKNQSSHLVTLVVSG